MQRGCFCAPQFIALYCSGLWGIWTPKWVIQNIGEYRSVSEAHKSNLRARISKNHQITNKLHTQCEQKQDNFGLSNHETSYY